MARDYEDITKQRNKPSTTLERALEAVKTEVQKLPGISSGDLEKAICASVPCSQSTVITALKMHRADGSISTKRDGRYARYYWEEVPLKTVEKVLPARRQVINAAEAPRVTGVKLSPFEWVVATLMEVTC